MSRALRQVTAKEAVRAVKHLGFLFDHQTGSHAVYYRESDRRRVVIPMHAGRTIRIGTLLRIIKDAGSNPDEFARLAK